MSSTLLSTGIETLGFIDGISFYIRWTVIDPIKIFYWKYIIAKPLCTHCGYFLCKSDCKHEKIIGRRNIIRYEKERHAEIVRQSKTIVGESDGKCVYCGEEKGTEIINDPNWDTIERWLVCKTCKQVIEIERELIFLSSTKINKPERMVELNNMLLEISKKTGRPIMSTQIERVGTEFEITKDGKVKEIGYRYDVSSRTYTGKK